MKKRDDVFKCAMCGNIVEYTHVGDGELICCGKPMEKLEENTVDAAVEKHVPIIEKIEGGYKVKVGEMEHPMIEKHFIEWIELLADNEIHRVYLAPGKKPEAVFYTKATKVFAREYCNIHGLWRSK
ncbi:MAG: desulfoferrodoxin [Bacteroidales bacterium]|jgi:superoxide reductase|nr:desulfoferrodoxin [Bacteroidales bacterium]